MTFVFRGARDKTKPNSTEDETNQTWPFYYWTLCEKFGAECYHTWRQELLTSVVVAVFIYVLSIKENRSASKDFQTFLLATGLTLAAFALWHVARIPWLIHKRVIRREAIEEHWGFGLLGVVVLASVLYGGYSLASYLFEIERLNVTLKIPAPSAQVIFQPTRPSTARTGLWTLSSKQANEFKDYITPECNVVKTAFIDVWRYDQKDLDGYSLSEQVRRLLTAACDIPTYSSPPHKEIEQADPFTGVRIFQQSRDVSAAKHNPNKAALVLRDAFAHIGFDSQVMYGEGVGKIAIVVGKKPRI